MEAATGNERRPVHRLLTDGTAVREVQLQRERRPQTATTWQAIDTGTRVQPRFAETRFAETRFAETPTLTLTLNPNP